MKCSKTLSALLVIFTSGAFVQAQLKVLSTGDVKIGTTSTAKIQSDATLKVTTPTVLFENTSSASQPKIQSNDTLQMNVPGLTIRAGDTLGFKVYTFKRCIDCIPINSTSSSSTEGIWDIILPPPVSNYRTEICLTGLSSNITNIGHTSMPITNVYAKKLYSLGGTVGTLSASDVRLKKNIAKISSVQNKIKSLNVVKYDFTKTLGGEDVDNNPLYKNKVGLLAQEVKDIFPDVVYYDPAEDFYTLDYAALIPYLIKSDQEQQDVVALQQEQIMTLQDKVERQEQIIAELQEQVSLLQKQSPSKKEASNKTHKLFQNAPNPFNQLTKIEYVLSESAINAKICIYDLNGKQLRCFNLNATKGASSIEVRASDLPAGIYLYTLIVDNMPIDTKRMILTE
jgi:hypothetical protein